MNYDKGGVVSSPSRVVVGERRPGADGVVCELIIPIDPRYRKRGRRLWRRTRMNLQARRAKRALRRAMRGPNIGRPLD